MNKKICFLIASFALSGCAATVSDQARTFDYQAFRTQSGYNSVSRMKDDYLAKTGHLLVAPDTLSCGWDGDCYYNVWANAYTKGINDFYEKNKRKEMNKIRAEQERIDAENAACNASPQCVKEKTSPTMQSN